MRNEGIGAMIPPDSSVVFYFGCGDGSELAQLVQSNPFINVFGVETDEILRTQARSLGLYVAKDAAEFENKLMELNVEADAWIIDRRGWQDETLTKSCRKRLMVHIKKDATLVWKFANSQYWQNLLHSIAGKAIREQRFILDEFLAEFAEFGVRHVETFQIQYENEPDFFRFIELAQPLLDSLRLPPELLKAKLKIDGFILRGRYAPALSEPLVITAILGETQVCARVRIDEPHSFLSTLPQVTCRRFEVTEEATEPPNGRHVWIWQRLLIPRERLLSIQKRRIGQRILTIQEWDDDPLHWENHFRDSEFFSLRSAHAIQTSTPALADYLRQFNPEVQVFPNCIASLPPLELSDRKFITLFYGALNRQADWKPILSSLNRILGRYKYGVQMIIVWDRELYQSLDYERKQFVPFCEYSRYMELLRQSDIAFLPMLPTRFNRMKSDLKFLECAAAGTTVLASPTVYGDSIRHGETGFIYHDEVEFSTGLTQLIEDSLLRRNLAGNAWEWVRENRMLSQHYRNRWMWYQSLFQRYDELTEAIYKRSPEMSD